MYGCYSTYVHYYCNYYSLWPYYGSPGYGPNSVIVRNPGSSGGSSGFPGGSSSGGSSSGSGSSGSPSAGTSPPSSSMGSQAGPRGPDSRRRPINTIKEPK